MFTQSPSNIRKPHRLSGLLAQAFDRRPPHCNKPNCGSTQVRNANDVLSVPLITNDFEFASGFELSRQLIHSSHVVVDTATAMSVSVRPELRPQKLATSRIGLNLVMDNAPESSAGRLANLADLANALNFRHDPEFAARSKPVIERIFRSLNEHFKNTNFRSLASRPTKPGSPLNRVEIDAVCLPFKDKVEKIVVERIMLRQVLDRTTMLPLSWRIYVPS